MTRLSFDALAALAILTIAIGAEAGPRLRVRGALHIDCHALRRQGRLVVEGRTQDDAGRPVGGHPLALKGSAPFTHTSACPGAKDKPEPRGDGAVVKSDDSGRFCVELTLPSGPYEITVDGERTDLLDSASAKLAVDLSKRAVRLRFDPEPHVITLDTFDGTLDAIADEEGEEAQVSPAPNLPLELRTEKGAVIGRATTLASGRASFALEPSALGPPGRGQLVVAFAGDPDVMGSEHAQPIERRAQVTLDAPASASGTPEDGVAFDVGVCTKFGDVEGGAVEALLGGVTVGAASVSGGRASLIATFATPRTPPRLTLRYVADRPYYVPASVATVPIEVREPSPLRQIPLVLGALAAIAWLLIGRSARKKRAMEQTIVDPKPAFEGAPRMAVIEEHPPSVRAWRGRVLDAHDGQPIAGVRVAIDRPSFKDRETFASAFTDADGRFELKDVAPAGGLMLGAEGPLHHRLERALPSPGMVEIALVLRKRRLLDRLVEWARRRGLAGPEPTPMRVREEALDTKTAEWAAAVERAAFDDVAVDARVEREIEEREPL